MNITSLLKFQVTTDLKNLFKNFSYLFVINIANYILPLITFPYIVRTVGVSNFGLLSLSLAVITYFTVIVDYGFNLYATREISINRTDQNKVSEICTNVLSIKVLLVLVCYLFLEILIFCIPEMKVYRMLYIYTFGLVLGQALMPVWYFQGIEKMKIISILFFLSKVVSSILIFVFLQKESEFLLVPLFNSITSIIFAIFALLLMYVKEVKFLLPRLKIMIIYLNKGWYLFISNISVALYTVTITAILGMYASTTVVGYYSICDKLISAIKSVITPFSQVVYPYLSNLFINSKTKVIEINKKILKYGFLAFLVLTILIFFGSKEILYLAFKTTSKEAIAVMKILSFVPIIIFIHTVYALFTILVFGFDKEYSKIIFSGGILNLFFSFILIPNFQHIGAACCVIIIEVYIGIRYYLLLKNKKIKLF
ncbi:flippase [Empedobacter falsenii]